MLRLFVFLSALGFSFASAAELKHLDIDWEAERAAISSPSQFAVQRPMNLDSETSGAWQRKGEVLRWRYRLEVPGASSLALRIDALELPEGSVLRIGDRYYTQPARTRWSRLQGGETLSLEMTVPVDSGRQPRLRVSRLSAGFPESDAVRSKQSDDCQRLNYACEASPDNDPAARATVAIVNPEANALCTAELINNHPFGEPRHFLLTAAHCHDEDIDIDLQAEELQVFYNYEVACGEPLDGASIFSAPSQTGAQSRFLFWPEIPGAGEDEQQRGPDDIWLLELNDPPPQGLNPHFIGFDATAATPETSVFGVHHQSGDAKQYFQSNIVGPTSGDDRFGVEFLSGQGLAGPGASGSGLIDAQGRLTGTLSTGIAEGAGECGVAFYSRLDRAWDEGLDALLVEDPGMRVVEGRDLGDDPLQRPAPSITHYEVTPQQSFVGEPVDVSWESEHTSDCTATGDWAGDLEASGTRSFEPPESGILDLTLVCSAVDDDDDRTDEDSIAIDVRAGPVEDSFSFSADPERVVVGETFTLSWDAANASACEAEGDWDGAREASGSETRTAPQAAQALTFRLNCEHGSSEASQSLTVDVLPALDEGFSFETDADEVVAGESFTLSWSAPNAESCQASGAWDGARGTAGEHTVTAPSEAQTLLFELACARDGETVDDALTVAVTAAEAEEEAEGEDSGGALGWHLLLLLLAVGWRGVGAVRWPSR